MSNLDEETKKLLADIDAQEPESSSKDSSKDKKEKQPPDDDYNTYEYSDDKEVDDSEW